MVELLAVVAIMGILVTITINTFVQEKNTQALELDTETVVETLRQARSQTLSSQNASQYGVHFASSTITLFAGSSYATGSSGNKVFNLSSFDSLTTSLTGGGSDVLFNRLSGETNQNGTIVVSSLATTSTKTVTIYNTGLVQF